VTSRVYLGFLNGYAPPWANRVVSATALALSLPAESIELRMDLPRYYSADRGQYNATLILAGLLRLLPDPHSKIVGITSVDLFIPVLTFVFGQAQLDGPGALVSTHRLHSEYYGLPRDEERLEERTIKEVVARGGSHLRVDPLPRLQLRDARSDVRGRRGPQVHPLLPLV
jgi:archaemetzincin